MYTTAHSNYARARLAVPFDMPAEEECKDLRFTPRKSTDLPAVLRSPAQFEPIPCRVVNVSVMGARVVVPGSHANANWTTEWLLGDLVLEIPMDRMAVSCRAVWKIDGQIGLRFRAAPMRLVQAAPAPVKAPVGSSPFDWPAYA